ncbi:MAG: HAD-IIA family hydrolase [Maritimibacter sp.]
MHTHPIRAAVFDIDGTLAMMDKSKGTYTALPGAIEALKTLESRGVTVLAYTNGTFFPPAHYYPILADAGLVLRPDHVWTPGVVAARALHQNGYKRVMVLGAEGTQTPIREAGIEVVPAEAGMEDVDAIMLGWSKDFASPNLEAICETIWAQDVPVYAASVAPFFASSNGRMLGVSGAVSAMVEYVTGVKVTVLGKPSTIGADMIAELTGIPPQETVVIGDDPALEIAMGRRAGSLTVGVTTGLNDNAAFQSFEEDIRANVVIDSLQGFADQPWLKLGDKT